MLRWVRATKRQLLHHSSIWNVDKMTTRAQYVLCRIFRPPHYAKLTLDFWDRFFDLRDIFLLRFSNFTSTGDPIVGWKKVYRTLSKWDWESKWRSPVELLACTSRQMKAYRYTITLQAPSSNFCNGNSAVSRTIKPGDKFVLNEALEVRFLIICPL